MYGIMGDMSTALLLQKEQNARPGIRFNDQTKAWMIMRARNAATGINRFTSATCSETGSLLSDMPNKH